MKHKRLLRAIIATIAISILFVPSTFATTGALKRASIKKCPDGKHYGYHTSKGKIHWHEAIKSNVSSGWSAIGPVLSGDPCPKKASNPTPSTAKQAKPSTGSSSSTTKPKTTTAKPKTTTTQPKQTTTTKPKTTTTQPKTTTQKPKTTEKKTETKKTEDTKKEEEKKETVADNNVAKEPEEKPVEESESEPTTTTPHYDYHSDYIKDYEEPKKQTNHTGDFLTLAAIGGGAYAIRKKRKKQ